MIDSSLAYNKLFQENSLKIIQIHKPVQTTAQLGTMFFCSNFNEIRRMLHRNMAITQEDIIHKLDISDRFYKALIFFSFLLRQQFKKWSSGRRGRERFDENDWWNNII